MRIAHFVQGRCNPDSANGVDKTVYYLSRAQAEREDSVLVMALSDKPVLPIPGVEVRHFPRSPGFFGVPKALVEALRQWRPDVVHLHSAYVPPNVAVGRALRRYGIPYAVTPNGVLAPALLRRRPYVKLPFKYAFERPLLNRAIFVHSVGDTRAIRRYGVLAPIVEAPNGFDPALAPRDLDPTRLRRELNVGSERIALYLGRLDVLQKGLDLLLQALQLVGGERRVHLVLVGPDWKGGRARLERLATKLEIRERISFWGPAYDRTKYELMAGADFFVHASRWEGLSFAVVEALSLAKPCLVTPAADPLGLVGRCEAGCVLEPDPRSIATGMLEMSQWTDVQFRAAGERARSIVEQHLSWSRIAERISVAYAAHCQAPA